MVVFVYVFPLVPGFKIIKNPWPAALVFTICELLFSAVAVGAATSSGMLLGFWAGMGGSSAKGASVIAIVPLMLALAFSYIFITALINASQQFKSVTLDKRSTPFLGALILLLIHGTVSGAVGIYAWKTASEGKAGYIDKTGKFVIEPKYKRAERFVNGIARVATDSSPEPPFSYNYRYIDRTGSVVATPKDLSMFEREPNSYRDVRHFTEGLAPAKNNSENEPWGFVDKSGKWVIGPKFEEACCFSEGLACVMVLEKKGQQRKLYGFIDKTGKYVIEPKFSEADSFSEGLAPATRY